MNTTLMNLTELENVAMAILFWGKVYPGMLPDRTAKMLRSGITNLDAGKLKEGIRLADLHELKFQVAIAEDAELVRLFVEEALIETAKLEAIGLHNYLLENKAVINPAKTVRFVSFLAELDGVLDSGDLAEVDAWIKRAKDFKAGIESKLRQAPRQTERRAA